MSAISASRSLPSESEDLLFAANVAVLATVAHDGRPQLTAVWYLFEGRKLRLTIRDDRHKLRNLMARPVATLIVVDPSNPLRTLEVRAAVELLPDDDYAFAKRIGGKYGTDLLGLDGPGRRRFIATLDSERVNYRG